ncbi:MAG: hypothetical protein GWN00_05310, partial [Aliifodinibius sp.]|nr:hypothetical protein [candidate division Zixibacteria bacterium]NIT55663.1 hypothetical protein [Fodinibius sp.]NIV10632.1 hypothetical protein [Fodinibius sp.]NIY24247.1 hypothetical protein [Fodinibius sp.]
YDFNEQPGHITVDVRIGNRSMQPTTFSAFSLHCSDMDDNVITFKVLNNDANASGDLTTMPLTVAAENTTNITLLAEKNTSYTSPADCQKMLVSWKVKNGKNQTGTPLTIAN